MQQVRLTVPQPNIVSDYLDFEASLLVMSTIRREIKDPIVLLKEP